MKNTIIRLALVSLSLTLIFHARASTNGDNLLGVGAGSRALGGVGVAAPPDALGAISANPAALSLLPDGPKSETDLSVTFFLPHVSASVGNLTADSAGKTYLIPSLALAGPLGAKNDPWQYGLAVYGVSGLGVDYYYETFRLIGFPAIVEHHLSVGLGSRLSDRSSLDAGYTHAFRNTITEQGTNLLGSPVTLSSRLSEDSFELGFKYRF